ncbi:O-antigen ligase family protein [Polynucleobacter necessarius]|uniref:O-antigen ligase family protein n=1 Tax=Polynucleobacter necessarius TaxID=576610 RepID=UPI000E08FBD5|nr:O-antigen ligase family protein [Polynucleobacter necessarius]
MTPCVGAEHSSAPGRVIPSWVIWAQSIFFSILYAVWGYPNTIFFTDSLIIIGAILSVYSLYLNRYLLKTSWPLPFWFLVAMIMWMIFHLFFLSDNFPRQFRELESIWKRVTIVMIYGLGFGLGISRFKSVSKCIILIYFGMIGPGLIYIFKYILGLYATQHNLVLPDYLILYDRPISAYWIYKTAYTVALMPTFAVGIGILQFCALRKMNYFFSAVAIFGMLISVLVFNLVNIKNAVIYTSVLTIIFLISLVLNSWRKLLNNSKLLKRAFLVAVIICVPILFSIDQSLEKNSAWKSFFQDVKVGQQVDLYEKWKEFGGNGFPVNENGKVVSVTVYYRTAWAIVGSRMLIENPLGYGLVYRSFANLGLKKWPNSSLDQVHSGWLDLALGIGVPGIILIFTAFLLVLYRLHTISKSSNIADDQALLACVLSWGLFAIFLTWTTSEISQGINLVQLIFWICFGVGSTMTKKYLCYR